LLPNNTAEAATAAGKSVAGIPFVGIAMAAAAVAGIIALFATLPKFAKGGIIGGGPSSGDKILARVNAGEMILNQGQQSNLFKAINSGKLGNANNSSLSSTVTTKVRAKDIILNRKQALQIVVTYNMNCCRTEPGRGIQEFLIRNIDGERILPRCQFGNIQKEWYSYLVWIHKAGTLHTGL